MPWNYSLRESTHKADSSKIHDIVLFLWFCHAVSDLTKWDDREKVEWRESPATAAPLAIFLIINMERS